MMLELSTGVGSSPPVKVFLVSTACLHSKSLNYKKKLFTQNLSLSHIIYHVTQFDLVPFASSYILLCIDFRLNE